MTPNTRVIGAAIAMVQAITTSSCTCCTSLVIRVMSDGAPKAPTSRAEKSVTWWNMALRDVAAEAHGHLGARGRRRRRRRRPARARRPSITTPAERM